MEDKNITADGNTPSTSEKQDKEGGIVFTQDQQKIIDSAMAERLARQQEKFEETLRKEREAFENRIKSEREEAEKLAKMSSAEREKQAEEKLRKELEQREYNLKLKENKLLAYDLFNEHKLPTKLVDFVVNDNEDVMKEKIELLKSEWSEALKQAVAQQMAGNPPKDSSSGPSNKLDRVGLQGAY